MSRKRRNTILVLILATPLVAADLALVLDGRLPLLQAGLPFVLIFALVVSFLFVLRKRDGQRIEGDERNAKIDGRAYAYSWYLTLYATLLLMANDQLGLVRMSTTQCLFLALAVLLASFWIFRTVLGRAGDLAE
jgi:hypothetical protein